MILRHNFAQIVHFIYIALYTKPFLEKSGPGPDLITEPIFPPFSSLSVYSNATVWNVNLEILESIPTPGI